MGMLDELFVSLSYKYTNRDRAKQFWADMDETANRAEASGERMSDADDDVTENQRKNSEERRKQMEKEAKDAARAEKNRERMLQQQRRDAQGMLLTISAVVGVATGMFFVLDSFTKSMSGLINQQNIVSESIGVSVEDLDKWSFALASVGGNAEATNGVLTDFVKTMSNVSLGLNQGAAEALGVLGLGPNFARDGDPTEQIIAIAGALDDIEKQFGEGRRLTLIDQLGLTEFIPLLNAGEQEIRQLMDTGSEFATQTAQQRAEAERYQKQLTKFNRAMRNVGFALLELISPLLTVTDAFVDAIKSTAGAISGLAGAEEALNIISKGLLVLVSIFGLLTTLSIVALLGKITASMWALSAPIVLLTGKFLLLAAVVGVIVLALEDFWQFLNGNDSLIGRNIDIINEKLAELNQWITDIKMGWQEFKKSFSLDNVVSGGQQLLSDAGNFLFGEDATPNAPTSVFAGSGRVLRGADATNVIERIRQIPAVNQNVNNQGNRINNNQGAINNAENTVNNAGNVNTTNAGNSVGSVTINVNGATNPQDTAKAIDNMLLQASQGLSSGVDS